MKPGGTDGGTWQFLVGALLCVVAGWLFFDSVRVVSGGGWVSGMMRGRGGGGMGQTTSMGILFVPFVIGLVLLFYNAKLKAGWVLFIVGLAIVVVEMVSRIRFRFDIKSTHLILMIVMFCAGAGFILRSVRDGSARETIDKMRGKEIEGGDGE
ncbi:MAG: hypothetical protein AAF591_16405 [Verrucomicrobiota bacterium]